MGFGKRFAPLLETVTEVPTAMFKAVEPSDVETVFVLLPANTTAPLPVSAIPLLKVLAPVLPKTSVPFCTDTRLLKLLPAPLVNVSELVPDLVNVPLAAR